MQRDKSQVSPPRNHDMHNDAGSERFTGPLSDYCLVLDANSFEEIEPQSTLIVSGLSRPVVKVVGA